MKRLIWTACISLILFSTYAKEERNEVQASLTSVTVYHSGAEMIHTTSAVLKTGNNELIIDNISNAIDSNSIQIKVPLSVTILHFEFSSNYIVSTTKTEHQQLLEDSLQRIQDNID